MWSIDVMTGIAGLSALRVAQCLAVSGRIKPSSSEVIVAQIEGDTVKPRTNITGNSGMMMKLPA
jgi:hypothetical protein